MDILWQTHTTSLLIFASFAVSLLSLPTKSPDRLSLPILVVHGYIERPDKDCPDAPDASSRLVAQAAFELIQQGHVRSVLLTTNQADTPKDSVANKISGHIDRQFLRRQAASLVPIVVLPLAQSTIDEVHEARTVLRDLWTDGTHQPDIVFLGISDHTPRIQKIAERTFGKRTQTGRKILSDKTVRVLSAEQVLATAANEENDYASLLALEEQDKGRKAFRSKERILRFVNNLPSGGYVMQLLKPVQKLLASSLFLFSLLHNGF